MNIKNIPRECSFGARNPSLLSEYHPDNSLDPFKVLPQSNKVAKWVCSKDKRHIWQSKFVNRNNGSGCTYCCGHQFLPEDSLGGKFPHLMKEWDPSNTLDPYALGPSSGKRVKWICQANPLHGSWDCIVTSRTKENSGCPRCSGHKASINSNFGYNYPELLKEWIYELNSKDPFKLTPFSGIIVWWQCSKNVEHKYEASITKRTLAGQGCPFCSGKQINGTNSFATLRPDLVAEWDYEETKKLDPELTPYNVSLKSDKRAAWKCQKNPKHTWISQIKNRSYNGCPKCSHRETRPEKVLMSLFNVPKYDQYVDGTKKIPYRPDIKINDSLYINADGLWSHSQRDAKYHFNLAKTFEANKLKIFQFYEDEIYEKSDIIQSMINCILGKNKRVGARKLAIAHLAAANASVFFDQNHLLGAPSLSRYIGLVDANNQIQMAIAYKVMPKKNVLDITRICSLMGVSVQGGLSKLLKCLTNHFSHLSITTQTDNRYADGHSFATLGFIKAREFRNYQYTNGKVRKDKRQFRVKKGTDERAEAAKKGFYRIYDAGKTTWLLKPTLPLTPSSLP